MRLEREGSPVEAADVEWTLTKDGVAPTRTGRVRLQGGTAIITGTLDYGQGHASAFAQVLVETQPQNGQSQVAAPWVRGMNPQLETNLSTLPSSIIAGKFDVAAAKATELLGVKQVIPMHYGTFPILEPNADRFVAELAIVSPGTRSIVLSPGEETTV